MKSCPVADVMAIVTLSRNAMGLSPMNCSVIQSSPDVTSGELWITLQFIGDNPIAFVDNVTIAITSATGQLFIFYTIKTFGPIVFTIIMTTRQMFSIVLSTVIFGHAIKPLMGIGAIIVFATIFNRIKRQAAKRKQAVPAAPPSK